MVISIKEYKLELFLLHKSQEIIKKKLEDEKLDMKKMDKLLNRYNTIRSEYNIVKDFIFKWLTITKETIINVKNSIEKIERSKTKNIEKKKKYLKILNARLSSLSRELNEYFNDCDE